MRFNRLESAHWGAVSELIVQYKAWQHMELAARDHGNFEQQADMKGSLAVRRMLCL